MPANNNLPAEMTPLREPTFFILLTLSNQKKHGYAILKDVETLSGGRLKLSTGTLYGALSRLLVQGVIQKSVEDNKQKSNDSDTVPAEASRRKYYELTQFGHQVLKEELQRLQDLLVTARQELGKEGV